MAIVHPHVGDVGHRLEVAFTRNGVPYSVQSASVRRIVIKPPNRAKLTFNASFLTDGTDGVLIYTTLSASDLPEPGRYEIMGYVEQPAFQGHSDVGYFTVDPVL